MRVLIVDDEAPARARLQHLLTRETDVSCVLQAGDGTEALALLHSTSVDVLFLDVQMPGLSGIEVAASLPDPAPLVVFATAHDAYALRAFDANAVDYLLKPFDSARLQRSLARVRERLAGRVAPASLQAALACHPIEQLLVSERGLTRVVRIEQIGWIETADNYVMLHTPDGDALLRQTLTGLLAQLGSRFLRCHRRAAVQPGFIEQVAMREKGNGELLLRGGMRVPCSRQYRAAVMEALAARAMR